MMRFGPSAKMMSAFVSRATTKSTISSGLLRMSAVRFLSAAPPGIKVSWIIRDGMKRTLISGFNKIVLSAYS